MVPYISGTIHHDCDFWYTCVKWNGWGDRVKGQKMIHNDQFQSVTLYISETVDQIIKSFGNHQEL